MSLPAPALSNQRNCLRTGFQSIKVLLPPYPISSEFGKVYLSSQHWRDFDLITDEGRKQIKTQPNKTLGGTLCSSWFHISLQFLFPQGQLNEDKLRCKLRALENQLQACTQVMSDNYWFTDKQRWGKAGKPKPNLVIGLSLSFYINLIRYLSKKD